MKKEVLVVEVLDPEEVAWKRAAALERNAEQEVAPGVATVGAVEGEVAAGTGGIRRGRVVPAEVRAELHRVRSIDPRDVVDDFVSVVAEPDGAEGVRIETEGARDAKAREARKIGRLLDETGDPGQDRVIGAGLLRLILEARTDIAEAKFVEQGGPDRMCFAEAPPLLAHAERNANVGLELPKRIGFGLVDRARGRERVSGGEAMIDANVELVGQVAAAGAKARVPVPVLDSG